MHYWLSCITELLYGREVRLPLGPDQEKLLSSPTHGPAKYVEELKKRQDILRKLVIKKSRKRKKTRNELMICGIELNKTVLCRRHCSVKEFSSTRFR